MYRLPSGSKPTNENIEKAVLFNLKLKDKLDNLENYYLGKHCILDRDRGTATKVNNKIVVNHARYITDINVGFLVGNPVEYAAIGNVSIDGITEKYKEQQIEYIDHRLANGMSKFGWCYDYTYANENAKLKTVYVDPRKGILVYDDTFEKRPLFAVFYSNVVETKAPDLNGKGGEYEFYDLFVVTHEETITYNKDLTSKESKPHSFGMLPVNLYLNNEDGLGDYEVVLRLIDAYNLLASDRINDKEQLVNAILVLKGATMTDKLKNLLRDSRILSMPKDASAEFISKALDESQMDVLRKAIKEEIHKISMTPDLSDENFTGNSSGVAIKYKLFGFEMNTKNKERYMKKSLADRFHLYSVYLSKLEKPSTQPEVLPYQVQVIFKRKLPQNDYEMSQTILNLEGKVSEETLVSQLSFVEDAEKEAEWVQEEQKAKANTDSPSFGTDNANTVNA